MKKNSKFTIFLIILMGFNAAASFAHPVTPTLIVERGLDSSMFGVALAAMMTSNFLFSPFWGKLCAYIPTKRVILICSLGYAVGQMIFGAATTEVMVVGGRMFAGIFTGGVFTAFSNFLFSPFWGKLCAYIPTKRVILICSLGYAVGQMIFGAATTEVMVVGGRMFAGIFTGGVFTAFSNYVINTSHPDLRGKNLTLMVTVQNVCGAVGYFLGGIMGVVSVEFAFICQIIVLAGTGVLFYILCEDDTKYKHIPEKKLSVKDANPFAAFMAAKSFMTPMLLLIFAMVAIAGVGQNSFEQCFNYYIKDQFNMGSMYNGTIKAAIAALSLIFNSTLCMWMQKKTDTNKSFMWIMYAQTAFLLILLTFRELSITIICDVLFFSINAVRLPLLQTMTSMRTTPENSNQVMGFYQSMTSLGGIFGALFAGLIYEANPMYPFILAAAAFVVATVIGFAYVGKYRKEKAVK